MATKKKIDWVFVFTILAGLFFIGIAVKSWLAPKSKAPSCVLKDGRYEVMADYYNPKRGTKKTHYMAIWIKDCEVEVANFADGGWLYRNNIISSKINKDSSVDLIDDDSAKYDMYILFGPEK